jgi:hypothetical protein
MAATGTKRTSWPGLTMSVHRGRADLCGYVSALPSLDPNRTFANKT